MVFGGTGYFFIKDVKAYWLGLALGTAVGILMFLQMAKSIESAVALESAQAQMFMTKRYLIRMVVYLVTVFASIRAEHINMLGTLLGLLCIKGAVILLAVLNKYQKK